MVVLLASLLTTHHLPGKIKMYFKKIENKNNTHIYIYIESIYIYLYIYICVCVRLKQERGRKKKRKTTQTRGGVCPKELPPDVFPASRCLRRRSCTSAASNSAPPTPHLGRRGARVARAWLGPPRGAWGKASGSSRFAEDGV